MRRTLLLLALCALATPLAAADHVLADDLDCLEGGSGVVGDTVTFVGALSCAAWDFVQVAAHLSHCFLLGAPSC